MFLFRIRLLSTGHLTSIIKHLFVFFSITTISGLRWSICQSFWIQTSHSILTISFSMTNSTLCLYHLSHTFAPYFLHKTQWIFKYTLSCLLLYSSVLTHCNHSLCAEYSAHVFCIICIYFRHPYDKFFLAELVFKACSCAADNKLSASRFKFQFLSQCHDFSDFLSSVSLPNWPCSFILLNWSIFSWSVLFLQSFLLSMLSFPNFSNLKSLYFLIRLHNILPHWLDLVFHTYVWCKS